MPELICVCKCFCRYECTSDLLIQIRVSNLDSDKVAIYKIIDSQNLFWFYVTRERPTDLGCWNFSRQQLVCQFILTCARLGPRIVIYFTRQQQPVKCPKMGKLG